MEELKALINDGNGHLIGPSNCLHHSAVMNEQLEIVQYLVKTCPTVDLIGQTNSMVESLHFLQGRKEEWSICSNSSLTITMEKTSKTSSIRKDNSYFGETPLDY